MQCQFTLWLLMIGLIVAGCGNDKLKNSYTGVLEGTSIKVPALTGGQIIDVLVDTGAEVNKGQRLAILDSTELVYQRQQLQATITEINVQAEMAWTGLERAKSNLDYLKEKHERIKKLYETSSVPRQNLDDLGNQLQIAETAYRTAQQQLKAIEANREKPIAQINIVRKKIKDTVVLAPTHGIITNKYFEAGEAVPPLAPLVEIIDMDKMETKIYIAEKRLPTVQYGEQVKVIVDGLDTQLTGKISWISPKAEFTPKNILTPETRASLVYAVKILIENHDGALKHGMPVVILLNNHQ